MYINTFYYSLPLIYTYTKGTRDLNTVIFKVNSNGLNDIDTPTGIKRIKKFRLKICNEKTICFRNFVNII